MNVVDKNYDINKEKRVQKHRRLQNEVSNRYPVPLPDVANMDDLATSSDEDLIVRLRWLEEHREKVIKAHMDPALWEIELAYIKREQQVRRARREAHDRFVASIEQDFTSEHNLPSADLDNSSFTNLQ